MKYIFQPLRVREALTVAQWHYPAPYEMYDLARIPLLTSVMIHHLQAPFGRMGFYGVHASTEALVGVFSFQVVQRTVELGLGLRPDLTGQHHGLGFVQAGMEFARAKYAPHQFRLDVAVFNQRAIRVLYPCRVCAWPPLYALHTAGAARVYGNGPRGLMIAVSS